MGIRKIVVDSVREGIRRVAGHVAEDIELVTGVKPEVSVTQDPSDGSQAFSYARELLQLQYGSIIVAGIYGESKLTEVFAERSGADLSYLKGKRECFGFFCEDGVTVISGSDQLGLEYGLFAFSEYCGVSPLVYWGDVIPKRCSSIEVYIDDLGASAHCMAVSGGKRFSLMMADGEAVSDGVTPMFYASREPSVKYRGFFINDEWPAFGRWCNEKFGGFTAQCYEQVFVFLLRMKGNYMWPAMWSSTFSEDGPGIANAELADIYGIYMGASHHEPMCRAGVEWQNIYKDYGQDNTWSFITNKKAITEFWRDGITRNKRFRNIITIGMRGENDSRLMSAETTLADNIAVIKDAILTQHGLIRDVINKDLKKVPRMLAIYKEVEQYYYGDPDTAGLKDWEELKDVIFMLCEDNFGNIRGLPTPSDLEHHKGGYGMYYHFDYHGAPVSYEWQNCVRLSKTREQMCMAYEYGIRDLWIVNVGDIKGVEYPLTYFMSLAYDYDRFCDDDAVERYASLMMDMMFGDRIDVVLKDEMNDYIDGITTWNSIRHPETMNPGIFSVISYNESRRVYDAVSRLMALGDKLRRCLPEDVRTAFESMFYYAGQASFNLILMHIEAARNSYYYERADKRADAWGSSVLARIDEDKRLIAEFNELLGGKWDHMMDSAHTGFKTWNDEGWSYPEVRFVSGPDSSSPVFDEIYGDEQSEGAGTPWFTAIEADEFTSNLKSGDSGWHVLTHLGRLGPAVKAYPVDRTAEEWSEIIARTGFPFVEYSFNVPEGGDYTAAFTFMARNPVSMGSSMSFAYSVNSSEILRAQILDEKYFTEWQCREWNTGVMTGVRTVEVTLPCKKGANTLRLYPNDPNVVFERVVICRKGVELPYAYLGAR